MKTLKNIYLVSLKGYEWNEPIEAFKSEQIANETAAAWTDDIDSSPLSSNDKLYMDMSNLEVTKIKLTL